MKCKVLTIKAIVMLNRYIKITRNNLRCWMHRVCAYLRNDSSFTISHKLVGVFFSSFKFHIRIRDITISPKTPSQHHPSQHPALSPKTRVDNKSEHKLPGPSKEELRLCPLITHCTSNSWRSGWILYSMMPSVNLDILFNHSRRNIS